MFILRDTNDLSMNLVLTDAKALTHNLFKEKVANNNERRRKTISQIITENGKMFESFTLEILQFVICFIIIFIFRLLH